MIALIWAQTRSRVIGASGGIPWRLPEDSRRFRSLTMGGDVVMGRKTWDSLPERFRPLPGRRNIVITHDPAWAAPGAERAASLDDALRLLSGDAWVIGGGEIYADAISRADRLEITEIDTVLDGDTLAPTIGAEWMLVGTDPHDGWATAENGLRHRFLTYVRR
jgi:dihydrofolate reductase